MSLSRLQKHMVAAAAVTAGIAGGASAAVVFQDVNIAIPNNIDGVYLNVVTLQQGTSGFAGYDINPYSAVAGQFNLWGPTTQTWFSAGGVIGGPYNLSIGAVVGGPATNFFRPGGGTNVGTQMNLNSSDNYLGFQFVHEGNGNQIHYGWIQLAFGATAGDREIIRIAYEDQAGVAITVVPAPGAIAMLGLAGLGLRGRRRK